MLSFFRRLVHSRVGVIVTFGVLIVIALAFAAGDVTGLRTTGMGALGGNAPVTIGKADLTAADLASRVQTDMAGFRQRQPTLTMAQFVDQGGFEGTLERQINSIAFDQFARAQGMVVSKATIDGQIASIPGLQGPTGKFDPQIYRRLLSERHLSDQSIRDDIAREALTQQLILPQIGASQVPVQLAMPYASLLLEKRAGEVGFIPTSAMKPGPAPTDAELQQFYTRNVARYSVPQRRAVRYALVGADQLKATPTEAEITRAYALAAPRFAASEKRNITQVIVPDQAGAVALAAKVKAGTSITDAARAIGLEASTQSAVTRATYAAATSAPIAEAVFTAAKGSIVGPIKGPLGSVVARVDAVDQVAARTLDQVRGELVGELTRQKTLAALATAHDAIDDALSRNATFDEIVATRHLTPATTSPLLSTGIDPANSSAKPDAALAPIVTAAFAEQQGDPPQLVPTAADGSFALVGIGRIVPAAPEPFAKVREAVVRDVSLDRARQAARRIAVQVVAAAGKGTSLVQALGKTSITLPPPQPLAATRAQLSVNPQGAPPPLALMFSMAPGTAKLLEAPRGAGWFVVKLDHVEPGDARARPPVVVATRRDLGRVVGREYAEQFAHAVQADVGVRRNAAAIAKVKAGLLGQGGPDR